MLRDEVVGVDLNSSLCYGLRRSSIGRLTIAEEVGAGAVLQCGRAY